MDSGWSASLHGPKSSPPPGTDGRALRILDTDITAHADWRSNRRPLGKLEPGERLVIDWNELYNIGMGDPGNINYPPLAPGRYQLAVQEVDVIGRPGPAIHHATILVPSPFWKSPWFWLGFASAALTFLFLGHRHLIRMNIRKHEQRNRMVETERQRIARDLHDDMGARISHIVLTTSYAETQIATPDIQQKFRNVSELARELSSALSEIIWTTNPENDHLDSLVNFICKTVQKLCHATSIRCRIDAPATMEARHVPSDIRHHTSLAVKEAVNNALKHSGTEDLHMRIRFESSILNITITDNGKGFRQDVHREGNGLSNMRQRIAAVKGKMTIDSLEGKHTAICFEIPVL